MIQNAENAGFGRACNQGAACGTAPYLLFLNPDTRLHVNALGRSLAFMDAPENADVGVCGIQLVDAQGLISRHCTRLPTLTRLTVEALGLNRLPGLRDTGITMDSWDHQQTRDVEHVIGAFYLIRRDLFHKLGGFDERYFVYTEDLDLSCAVHQTGWRCVYLADAQAFHAGGGVSRQIKARRLFYSRRSRLLYGFKHLPRAQAWVLLGVTLLLEPWARLGFRAAQGDWSGMRDTARAYRLLWGAWGEIINSTRQIDP